MIFASHWGLYYGFLAAVFANAEEDEGEIPFMRAAGNAAVLAAALGMPKLGWSSRRVWLVHLGGLVGVIGGLGVGMITDPDSEAVGAAIMTVGGVAGLVIGIATTRNDNPFSVASGAAVRIGGALFNLHERKLELGVPMPMPALVPSSDRGRRSLGLQISLLKGTF